MQELGKFSHISQYCPKKVKEKHPAQIHAMNTVDDDSEASEDESVIILTLVHNDYDEYVLTQKAARKTINLNLVLLNSQLTVNLFTDPEHVRNILPATTPINVHCNKGTLTTHEEVDFGDSPVYFDDRGITNVLSLYHLGKKFKITYDSMDRGGVFKVSTKQGVVARTNGLHALNLKTHPKAAFLLINDADLLLSHPEEHQVHVATVRDNYENFSRKQIEGAQAARRLMGMIATPSTHDFNALVRLHMIPDCPITTENIKHADTLFGPDLATTIRGKTVQRKLTRVVTDYVDILRALVDINKQVVTLAADVMFVNLVLFLVSVSGMINLVTIEHAPKRTATKLGDLIQRIIRVYARAGFTVQTVLIDNKFEKLNDHVPMLALNIPAASGACW